MKLNYRCLGSRWYAMLALSMFFSANLLAQSTVSGTVSDDTGPLPGVNVVVQGTTNGTITDFDGLYTLGGINSGDTLVFSFLGLQTQLIAFNGQETLDILLVENSEMLDELVVVGYGTQSRAAVTGAISTIDADEISELPVATADQALQGRAAGVTVINSGSPGSSPVVRIRGLGTMNDSEPLYVIDGVISSNGLGDLNASDIASINVLKDASTTAVYGSLGSNGVVVVTTKKGSRFSKLNLSYDGYVGTNWIDQRYDLLNREQYIEYANDWGENDGTPIARITDPQFSGTFDAETDWQDELFQSGYIQSHSVRATGGGENSDYLFSAGYLDQEGAVINTGFERYNFRANSNFNLGKLKLGQTLNAAFGDQDPERESGGRSLIEHAIKMPPYLAVYNENNLGGFQGPDASVDAQDAANPIRVQEIGDAQNKSLGILGSIYAEYELIEGLKFKTFVGGEFRREDENRFTPSYNDDDIGTTGSSTFAVISKDRYEDQSVIFTNTLNYVYSFNGVHNFDVLALAENQKENFYTIQTASQNSVTNEVEQIGNEQLSGVSRTTEHNRISYMGRINYNYDNKYIFAASYRTDGDSRFGENEKWGSFPSVAVGWNISREDFMANSGFSNLKLRASWGIVGNNRIGDYQTSPSLTSNFNYPINGQAANGTTANGVANPDLKWEETTMTNVGLDLGFLNGAIGITAEYYRNESDDLLIELPTPVSNGNNQAFVAKNVGAVETDGFELTANYFHEKGGDFTWSVGFNIGTSSNEVTSLATVEEIFGGSFENQSISRISVGESLFHFYGLKTDGIYQNQAEVDAVFTANPEQTAVGVGDIRFVDINGDGDITSADRTVIGNPWPDFTYGVNFGANYKNFDFSLFIQGVSGVDIYNTNIYDLQGMPRLFNSGVEVLDRWTESNPSNSIPKLGGATQNLDVSDRFIEDGSYARLKNLGIGYTLRNVGGVLTKARFYASAQNLVTITDYSGLDPEIGTPVNRARSQFDATAQRFENGIDRGNYPQPKTVILGVQITF